MYWRRDRLPMKLKWQFKKNMATTNREKKSKTVRVKILGAHHERKANIWICFRFGYFSYENRHMVLAVLRINDEKSSVHKITLIAIKLEFRILCRRLNIYHFFRNWVSLFEIAYRMDWIGFFFYTSHSHSFSSPQAGQLISAAYRGNQSNFISFSYFTGFSQAMVHVFLCIRAVFCIIRNRQLGAMVTCNIML